MTDTNKLVDQLNDIVFEANGIIEKINQLLKSPARDDNLIEQLEDRLAKYDENRHRLLGLIVYGKEAQ